MRARLLFFQVVRCNVTGFYRKIFNSARIYVYNLAVSIFIKKAAIKACIPCAPLRTPRCRPA